MKETVAAFTRRTGRAYDPPAALRALARALGPREACPTLFRYPGPEGLRDALLGSLRRLAPPGRDWVWLASAVVGVYPRAVKLFGTVAVLEPLRLSPCLDRRGVYLGANREIPEPEALVWTPPSAVGAAIAWDRIRAASDARRRFGPRYDEERAAVSDRLSAYLEELSELHRAGASGPQVPWWRVSARERRSLLERYSVRPRWTLR